MRRQIAVVAVAALLLFAGCNGAGGPATDAPTTNGTTGSGDAIYETPLDANAVAGAHLDALRDAGSYTITSNATSRSAGQNSSTVVHGDLASGAVYTRSEAGGQNVEVFAYGNGTAYQRLATGDRAQYVNASGRAGNASQYARGTVTSFVGLFDFTHDGTTTEDGATVHVYEAAGVEAVNTSAPAFSQLNESAIQSANATLHVRDDGIVTLAEYDLTVTVRGNQQSVDATQRFVDVGETDVSPPEWIAEAHENATNPQAQ